MHIQSEQQRLCHRLKMNISNIGGFLSSFWTGFIHLGERGEGFNITCTGQRLFKYTCGECGGHFKPTPHLQLQL